MVITAAVIVMKSLFRREKVCKAGLICSTVFFLYAPACSNGTAMNACGHSRLGSEHTSQVFLRGYSFLSQGEISILEYHLALVQLVNL